MADIFHEVEEELRKDKYQDMLRKYGPLAAAVVFLIIASVAGVEGWKAWTTSQREAASLAYTQALDDYEAGRTDVAAIQFEDMAANGPDGYAVLALMQRGAMALSQGEPALATAFFEQAAERSDDPVISDLAMMKAVWATFEDFSFDDLSIRLGPLTEEGRPYQYLAREAIGIAALNAGEYDRAREEFESITYSLDAPDGVRARANAAMTVVNRLAPDDNADTGVGDADQSLDAASGDAVDTNSEFNLNANDRVSDGDAFGDSILPELEISTDEAAENGQPEGDD